VSRDKPCSNSLLHIKTLEQGRIEVLWGLKLIKVWGAPLRKRIQNYEHKIRYESEYLFRMRKEVTTNYKFEKADKYHKGHKIQKNYVIFLSFNCRTHPYNT
jgi:tRNA splicing ligase